MLSFGAMDKSVDCSRHMFIIHNAYIVYTSIRKDLISKHFIFCFTLYDFQNYLKIKYLLLHLQQLCFVGTERQRAIKYIIKIVFNIFLLWNNFFNNCLYIMKYFLSIYFHLF